ncbi:MAG: DUF2029 domain-containing protein, partial [Anaerolinea sp.]|nr:DUF2029 domain-containing protein [Anaerolinea sp.]
MTTVPALTARARIQWGALVYWSVVALLWIGWVALAYWMARYGQWGLVDFRVYHEAAGFFARGASPYFGTGGMYFLYPPLLGQLLIPLAGLNVIDAWHIWFAVNLILLLGTLALVSRTLPPTGARLLWITPLLFEPILDSIYIGQVTIIILALLTGAWIARREDRPYLAGALIAAAAWLKVYPGLLALYFLWKRDWRVVRGIVIAGIALALLQIAVSGLDPFADSFGVVFALAEGGQSAKASVSSSILGFTTQMFTPGFRVTPLIESPVLHTISRLALTAGAVIALAAVTGRRSTPP